MKVNTGIHSFFDARRITRDPYHKILTWPVHYFFIFSIIVYLLINTVFAFLYMLDPGCIANAKMGNFLDHFFFSVQSISTIGYGLMYPKTDYANYIVTAQVYVGVINLAMATGLLFARFSRPSSKIVFSNKILITEHNGEKSVMLRLANERKNQIVDAKIYLTYTYNEITKEGILMRRFENLLVRRKHNPLLELSWTVIHTITKESPFYNKTLSDLKQEGVAVVATLVGFDSTFSHQIYSKQAYGVDDIKSEGQFADIVSVSKSGNPKVNTKHIHDITS